MIFSGGDYKFLLVACGIGATTSDYACVWCTISKSERGCSGKKWFMTDQNLGARTGSKDQTVVLTEMQI